MGQGRLRAIAIMIAAVAAGGALGAASQGTHPLAQLGGLLWGVAIDRVVWHVLPSARVCFGGGIVIASGLYVIWHERTRVANGPAQGQNVAPIVDS